VHAFQGTFCDELSALLALLRSVQNLSEWNFVQSVHSLQEVFIV